MNVRAHTQAEDAPHRQNAAALQRAVGPWWVVFWGPASRRFWAFRRGGLYPLVLSRATPNDLYEEIQRH
jgi:hypothetical protein